MQVMVRVQMVREAADQAHERVELLLELLPNRGEVGRIEYPAATPCEFRVQAEPQLRIASGSAHSLDRMPRVDEKARAADDAVIVGIDNAVVRGFAHAEVVGIDDELAAQGGRLLTGARGSLSRAPSRQWYPRQGKCGE